ncbi:MAG: hypothetical protein KGK11_02390 [Sphingomonadales bacterium]|nr:hypothetical protein [Sphingomonadales bacterium]
MASPNNMRAGPVPGSPRFGGRRPVTRIVEREDMNRDLRNWIEVGELVDVAALPHHEVRQIRGLEI